MKDSIIRSQQKQTLRMDRAEIYDRPNITVIDRSMPTPPPMEQDGIILRIIKSGINSLLIGKAQNSNHPKNIKYEVKSLLLDGKIEEAMDRISYYAENMQERHLLTEVFILSGRLNRLTRAHAQGTISKDDLIMERDRIKKALSTLASQLSN